MKKRIFVFFAILFPVMLLAQPMDTTIIFREDFEGDSIKMSVSQLPYGGGVLGDWRIVSPDTSYEDWNYLPLYNSPYRSFHSPVYFSAGNSNAITDVIPLSSTGMDVNHVYIDFDHICKVNYLDNATLHYQVAEGVDDNGDYNWGTWKILVFASNSPFYYGDAKSTNNNAFSNGALSDKMYSNWQSNDINAVPNNTWWHHEKIDLTQFIFAEGTNPTHFRFLWRLNKISPSSSGSQVCAGWYIDNVTVRVSNCELIRPEITMVAPFFFNDNSSFTNNVGPYTIKAKLFDNDTIAENLVQFSYEINSGPTVIVSNTNAFTSNALDNNGHTIMAQWELPSICYRDTIHYHIYLEDIHGSNTRFDTFFVAHHNYTNIQQNDIRLDSLNSMPHCMITNSPQNVEVYFTNRSEGVSSPNSNNMVSGTFTLEVRDENNVLFHDTTCTWSGDICFDIPSSLSLGTFAPRHGYNYVTVYVNTRNGQADGYHVNDTLRITSFSCDSLLRGDYTVGGANPDFADMTAVKEALEFCGLGGPVVFLLRPGTYTDFDFDENYINQSAVNTITFQGDDVNTVIVTNNHTDAGANIFGAVTLVNVKNYSFKNLTIRGNESATASRGVVVRGNGSTNILFEGCKITAHNTQTTASSSCAVGRTTAVPNGGSNYPDTITFRNCTLLGGNYGFFFTGSATRRNFVTIDSCSITSCHVGVHTHYSEGPISNNHIKQVNSTNPQDFFGIFSSYMRNADICNNTVDSVVKLDHGIYLSSASGTSDFYVRGNRIHAGNGTVGLYVSYSSSTDNSTGYLYNNEVILYPVTADNSYAMKIENCNGLHLINNSLLAKSDAPYSNTAALYISNSSANEKTWLYNNILLNQVVCSDRTDYPIYLNANAKVSGSYNDFHSGSGVIAYKMVPRNTVAELEAADTNLNHSISLLPPFANVTQSLLPSSFTGLECWRDNAVMTDIRGMNRTEVTYMGAYANAVSSVDAALTALVSPVQGECSLSSYDITVEITNKGSQTINFAGNPAVIHLHSAALNLDQDIPVNTGSVTALNSMNKVLIQNVSIPVNQMLDFQITITTQGDINPSNDTLSQIFVLETIVPDYEENFSNGTQQTWTIQQISGVGNWTFQNGTGENPAIDPVYGTGRLFFNSKNFSNTTVSRAILPAVTLNNSVNPILELWFAHDNVAPSKADGVTVKISTDGGVNYTDLIPEGQTTAFLKRYKMTAATPQWQLYTFDLANYVANECVYIAFDAAAKGGNNINIDRIRVRNLYDNDVAVTKIYGAGETPTEYSMRGVVSALVRNEGTSAQSNVQVCLNVTGANEQWQDTLTIPSLPYQGETLVTFPDHQYSVQEVKDVEVSVAADQNNVNNTQHWRMVTSPNGVNYADTATDILLLGDYTNVIRPCVRYKTNEELVVTAVKYYYDQTYIADPENGFKAFVADASGNILATSELVDFSTLQQGAWNTIPIHNFALTNTVGEFYVGLEMFAHGNYLAAQVETPLRDSAFYYLQNGVYVPQTSGRFMIGAVVDTPFVQDVALLELVNPVTNCDLGHEHLKVLITNNGTTDIVPPIQLHYAINGVAVVTEDFTDTLHSHETTLFTFVSDYDFTNHLIDYDSNYNVRVWFTKLAQDRLSFNDTLEVLVVSRGKSPMPIVSDTVFVSYNTSTTLTAQLPASIPQGVIGWFASTDYESWNLLGYGDSYTTPLIKFDTTYYATASPGFEGCGSEKVPIRLHVTDIPTCDVETQELVEPVTGCALYDEHIKVQLKNMLNIPIPANKVVIHAVFNGTEITHTVADTFASEEVKIVEFATPFNFSAPTTDITFNYTIYTTLNDEAVVYTDNDTIFGSFVSWRTAYLPDSIVYTGAYTNPYDILQPADRPADINQYYFYANENDATPIYTSTTAHPYYTTPDLYDTAVYWVSGTTKNGAASQGNHNCVTKRIKVIINVFHPQYDFSTDELIYPVSYQCLSSLSPNLQVSVTNRDTTSISVIPAGTFNLNAQFTGFANVSATSSINDPVASLVQDTITFPNGMNFGSATQNSIYQYLVYTTPANPDLPVFRGNDSIYGSLYIPAMPVAPEPLTYTVPYGGTQTVTPDSSALNHYYFYENASDNQTMAEGSSFTTEPIYAPITYYYSGRIESDGFNAPVIAGTGNDHSDVIFNFGKGHSYAKVLYNKEDLGGSEGRIDSIYFQVSTAEANGIPIPMRFWLKDTANVQAIATGNMSINWDVETANATLVFDGEIALDQQGWVGFAVAGGYDFNGEGLLLFAEHDCGDNCCLNTYGINPVPKFLNSSTNGNKVYTYSNNSPVIGSTNFLGNNKRVNTKFKMNYTCESPKAPITINTEMPQHDVGVVAVTAPMSQSNSFTANENVAITLRNFGSQTASNIPVSYQFANGTPVTENYSGTIASGEIATMSFNAPVDLTSVYFPTLFRAYTGFASDTYHPNDTTAILLSTEDPCPSRPLSSHDGAHITNVSMGSLNNGVDTPYTNHPTAPGNGMYSDYTQTVAPVMLILGQDYTLSVTHAFTGTTTKSVYKKAYIDYNRNGVFTDPGEEVFSVAFIPEGDTNAVTAGFVNVPTDVSAGLTRMRVICSSVALNSSGNNANCPCGFYNGDGETEDYAVLLSAPMDSDLGISAILHPNGEVCADSNATMRVNIRNYGTVTQTLGMGNPVTVTATVTGAVSGTYSRAVDSVTLSSNDEMTVSIPNVNLGAPGQYHVSVQLDYSDDQYMTNNTRSIDASVSNIPVWQLPFVEPFNPQNTDLTNPQLAAGWEVTSNASNYMWMEVVGASPNNEVGGGPAHDHTFVGTDQENIGGYVSVPGQSNTGVYNKWTSLTSGCVNMHHRNGYPSELYFYKYFADKSGTDFVMRVETGSGGYYQTIGQLTKADGGQVGGDDEWNDTLFVLYDVDEVARLRFTVTNQYGRVDPSIDDINLIVGRPDMAVNRIIYPTPDSCLSVNSIVVPVIELYNNGNSAVEEFDVKFQVGAGSDTATATEHVVHHLESGESMIYTSINEFVVANFFPHLEVLARVIIPDDKNEYNNLKRILTCTDVSVTNYEGEGGIVLGQNEPNPAVTVTRIPYSVPEPGRVTLGVENALGQLVYTDVQEAESGDNHFLLNANELPAGVYFYSIRYNDTVLTRKMVVKR